MKIRTLFLFLLGFSLFSAIFFTNPKSAQACGWQATGWSAIFDPNGMPGFTRQNRGTAFTAPSDTGPIRVPAGMHYLGGFTWGVDSGGYQPRLILSASSTFINTFDFACPQPYPVGGGASPTTGILVSGDTVSMNNGVGASASATVIVDSGTGAGTTPTPAAKPVLTVTNECVGNTLNFKLNWTPSGASVVKANGNIITPFGFSGSSWLPNNPAGSMAPNSVYTWTVTVGTSAPSDPITTTTKNCAPPTPQATLTLDSATCVGLPSPGQGEIKISWSSTGTPGTVNIFRQEYSRGAPNQRILIGAVSDPSKREYKDSGGVMLDSRYTYNIQSNAGTSNSMQVAPTSSSCTPQRAPAPDPTPAPTPVTPGPFTVTASTACVSPTTVHITLDWTATRSANATEYQVSTWDNAVAGTPTTPSGATSYSQDVPANTVATRWYRVIATVNGNQNAQVDGTGATGTTMTTLGTTGSGIGVNMPNCAPAIPGAFMGTITLVCSGSYEVVKLNWSSANGATAYNVFYGPTSDISEPLGTFSSLYPTSPEGLLGLDVSHLPSGAYRSFPQGLRFHIVASNDGGISEIYVPQDINNQPTPLNCAPGPDVSAPVPVITLNAVNSACSAGNPSNVITWTSSDGTAAGTPLSDFSVFRDGDATAITTSATSPYTDSTVTNNSAHTYKVTSGTTEASINAPATNCPQLPPKPTLVASTECNIENTKPINQLSWYVASRGTASDEIYQVLRDGIILSTSIPLITPLNASDPTDVIHYTASDKEIAAGDVHDYVIRATNTTGTSDSAPKNLVAKTCTPPTPVAANLAPAANDDSATTPQNTAIVIDVLANDTDSDGQIVPSCTKVTTQPAHGTTAVDTANGKITFTPTNGYTGADTFTYEICDDKGATATGKTTITVTAVIAPIANHSPIANDDAVTTQQDTAIAISVLSNDTDPDNNLDPAGLKTKNNPTNGTVILTTDHLAAYTPKAGFSGTDTFTYEVCDTGALCDTASVSVTVTATPAPVLVLPGQFTLHVQSICLGQVAQNVLTWDASNPKADSYIVHRDTQTFAPDPANATKYIDSAVTDGATYIYTIDAKNTDGTTPSVPLTIKTGTCKTVTPVANNLPPQANDDALSTDQNGFIVADVLLNDKDPDGQIVPSCTKVVTAAAHGATILDPANGKIAYTPTKDFNGTDTFIYQICDDKGATATAKVTIVVKPSVPPKTDKNSPPQANDDASTTPNKKSVDIDILLNDADPDSNIDPACVKVTKQPGHGKVEITATNIRAIYTPAADFSGTDTFQYTVCDKAGVVSNAATVSIAVGQAPPAALVSTGIPIIGWLIDLWNKALTFLHLR
jgi:hypothetical protein